jgi:DNA polymerase-3 subunit delta
MNPQEFFQEIQGGKLWPLYYFWGPENWLVEEALKKIEEKALNPGTRDFNREVLNAEEAGTEALVASLQGLPVRSPRRLVIIRGADWIWRKAASHFLDYLHNPNPRACAVLIGEKADLRTKFFQTLGEKGAVVAFFPPHEKDLRRWVRSRVGQCGHTLTEEAAALLLERVGPTLREIEMELQKLISGKEAGKMIEGEDVLALTQDTRGGSPFDLSRAVGRLEAKESLRLLRRNLEQGESPVLLFSLLVRQLRLIRRARELLAQGVSKREVEGKLRVLPRNAEDFWKQVGRVPPHLEERLWRLSLKTDRGLKSTRTDKGLLLEEYIFTLLLNSG